MKKYIFTENQIKKIIDSQLNEQMNGQQSGYDYVYNNPTIKEQLAKKKFPSGTKFGFSQATVDALSNPKSPRLSHSNILYQVKPGDTIDGIVNKMGANSKDNVLGDNDLLRGNAKAIQPGMIITFSLLPSGN